MEDLSEQKFLIQKANGSSEYFDDQKFLQSLHNAGVDGSKARLLLKEIKTELKDGMHTQVIYRKAFRYLKSLSRKSAASYNLKRAIMDLGPSGYPFERLVAHLYARRGYETTVGCVLKGFCVDHEVDVIATNQQHSILIECKFHNQAGHKNDVKIPLYVKSRFDDIKKKRKQESISLHENLVYGLATNTRFSKDAIQYAQCNDIQLTSWDFPTAHSIKHLIAETQLHPLTCLTHLSLKAKRFLLDHECITCTDVLENQELLVKLGLSDSKIRVLIKEIETLIF